MLFAPEYIDYRLPSQSTLTGNSFTVMTLTLQ